MWPDGQALVVPAMPARDWVPAGGTCGARWPAELCPLPLLKVSEILSVIGSEHVGT